jgi:hypothetical protein
MASHLEPGRMWRWSGVEPISSMSCQPEVCPQHYTRDETFCCSLQAILLKGATLLLRSNMFDFYCSIARGKQEVLQVTAHPAARRNVMQCPVCGAPQGRFASKKSCLVYVLRANRVGSRGCSAWRNTPGVDDAIEPTRWWVAKDFLQPSECHKDSFNSWLDLL